MPLDPSNFDISCVCKGADKGSTAYVGILPWTQYSAPTQGRMQDIVKGGSFYCAHEKFPSTTPTFVLATPFFNRACRCTVQPLER